jgi:hypothetical protein
MTNEQAKATFKALSARRAALNQDQPVRARIQAHKALSRGKQGQVCYYPACGSDFDYPLRLIFPHLCVGFRGS